MIGYDQHYRITKKDGTSHVDMARVWDGQRYLAALAKERAKEEETVVPITKEQYDTERKAK